MLLLKRILCFFVGHVEKIEYEGMDYQDLPYVCGKRCLRCEHEWEEVRHAEH